MAHQKHCRLTCLPWRRCPPRTYTGTRKRRQRDLELMPERKRCLILEMVEGSWDEHPTHKRNTHPCTPCLNGRGTKVLESILQAMAAWCRQPNCMSCGFQVGELRGEPSVGALQHLAGGPGHLKKDGMWGTEKGAQVPPMFSTKNNRVTFCGSSWLNLLLYVLFKCERSPFKPMWYSFLHTSKIVITSKT